MRSRGDGNLRVTDLERFDRNYQRSEERYGPVDFRLIVFNGMYRQPADERAKHPPFGGGNVVEETEDRGICLLSVQQLLEAIEAVRNSELTTDQAFGKLHHPGVADLPGLAA